MTAAETALRNYLENNTEDCSICLADEYAHGHIAFCIRGGRPIHSVFINAEGDLYFYSRRPGHLQAKGYMKPTEQETIDLIRYINNELVGWEMIKYYRNATEKITTRCQGWRHHQNHKIRRSL